MKVFITILLLLFFCTSTHSQQSLFDKGYQDGYKEGYCYLITYGCISPIPPIPPIPNINESSKSYKDGYNRGFLAGQKKKEEDDRKNKQGSIPNTATPNRQWKSTEYQPLFDDNLLSLYMQTMQIRQQQQKQQYAQLLESERMQIEAELRKTKQFTTQTLNLYSSLNSKTTKVADGWHTVIALNRIDFCENRLVRVQNNKIVEYYVDTYKWDDHYSERQIIAGGNIDSGKTIMKLIKFGETNQLEALYLEIYFIDYLMNPNSKAQPPINTGKISFWTKLKNGGIKYVTFDGQTLELTKYFKDGTPYCDEDGTALFEAPPGNYTYSVKDGKRLWQRTITVVSGYCLTVELTK